MECRYEKGPWTNYDHIKQAMIMTVNDIQQYFTSSDPKKGALVYFFKILKFWEKAMLSIPFYVKIRLTFFFPDLEGS
jgi:hypothetical protein